MAYTILYKDPVENLAYDLDWTAWLDGDTIMQSVWTVPVGLNVGSSSYGTQTSSVVLSGGTLGEHYTISNAITTSLGRVANRTLILRITSK